MTISIRRYPAIEHREERRDYPLSYQQERVLYLDQLAPGGALWNLISAKRLTGRLNAEAMRGAVEELAGRHAALRTKIELAQPPLQSFGSFSPEQFRLVDLSQGDPDSREQALAEWFSRECREPIDIRGGDPLFQATLVQCGADEALLVLKLHHIVSDATTFQL
ncbi:condensation domain-containing protein, partial [Paenibacillus zanthoxyli]|uniref:condensation domain-containing protein n=1 Tax=Paenibacillus zanthoxyli TaxID=369399 RepID=UPI000471F02C